MFLWFFEFHSFVILDNNNNLYNYFLLGSFSKRRGGDTAGSNFLVSFPILCSILKLSSRIVIVSV